VQGLALSLHSKLQSALPLAWITLTQENKREDSDFKFAESFE